MTLIFVFILFCDQYACFLFKSVGVNSMPQVQLMQPDPLPRHVDGAIEDGVLNINLQDPDEN